MIDLYATLALGIIIPIVFVAVVILWIEREEDE